VDNPFAIVVMAHLKALETKKDNTLRKQWKIELTRLLYQRGYSKKWILALYSFIDWVLSLPEELEKIFLEDLKTYEREKNMPYVTSAERIGRKEGKREGKREGGYVTFLNLVQNMKKNNLSEAEIARMTGCEVEVVRRILNNEQVDIPGYLLEKEGGGETSEHTDGED
jgi:hypothetical protein